MAARGFGAVWFGILYQFEFMAFPVNVADNVCDAVAVMVLYTEKVGVVVCENVARGLTLSIDDCVGVCVRVCAIVTDDDGDPIIEGVHVCDEGSAVLAY